MSSYKDSGVDIEVGDEASAIAYNGAKSTFASRRGLIGEPVSDDGGFAGLLDMGDYYLVQGDDGVGTKIEIAEKIEKFDTLGYDLLAMVCDDAVCMGAETISVTNTLDTNKVSPAIMSSLMQGLVSACNEQKIVIPGGEIAELGNAVNGNIWNATAVGVVEKNKVITSSSIKEGDAVLSLKEDGFRSNGFSLVRYIMKNTLGDSAYHQTSPWGASWGEMLLTPSTIYSSALLSLIGRFKQERLINIKGIAHITGGGIPGNICRILKKNGLGVDLPEILPPSAMVQEIQSMGKVEDEEAYKTWNMGNGMMLITDPSDVSRTIEGLLKAGISAQQVGLVTKNPLIRFKSQGVQKKGEWLEFTY